MNRPRHPKANHFNAVGLMAGVQSFSELEARIAGLPTEQSRGAALEVFAEACLATQRIYQAREVWPGNSMPSTLRQKLRLPLVDMGVDGVFVTPAEEAVCYQSKFRTGRPALTWTELSTFYGLVDTGARRLVFTNCDEIASVAEERLGAIFVRGSDLDRLTPEDFQIIAAWLAERPASLKKKDPKPHQVAALSDIVSGLSRGPRATALMACGSGKTLVALWGAEQLGARTVLVLLPSLALVRQTLHEWLHETSWPDVQFLCVCSDPTVQTEEDSLVVRPSDLDFAVTTQSADVRRFLERETSSVRLVFSTYQSSQVVAAAIQGLPPFDLGVFDEAHKTAGREGARFALALKDENLPIARRLFLTATPRHYDVARKDKFGESKVVFSMDAAEVYGPVVHRLPFSAAAKAGIITDYKVIISVVTSEMVTDEALRLGVVLVDGDEVKARQVANQIALKSAIEKYGVSKVFTFHSKVNSAKSFTSSGQKALGRISTASTALTSKVP
jgi:predicted helicase